MTAIRLPAIRGEFLLTSRAYAPLCISAMVTMRMPPCLAAGVRAEPTCLSMRSLLKRLSALATDMIRNKLRRRSLALAQIVALAEGLDCVLRQSQRVSDRCIAHALCAILRNQQLFACCHLSSLGDLQSLHRVRYRQLHIDALSNQIAHMVIKRVQFQNAPDSPLSLVIDKHLLEIAE